MKIELKNIKGADLFDGYVNKEENGVRGYGGKLDIRPPYQREFVYKPPQEQAVIHTVLNGFPLNTIYWAVRDDGTYEVIDGQQRTLSLCRYIDGKYAYSLDGSPRYFFNLTDDLKQKILDYELTVYFCAGSDSEKLDWFKVINIAGEKLTDQELRNAVYHGPWLSDAKKYFSYGNCVGYNLSKDYVTADVNRQGLLELVLKWISQDKIDKYMADHQHNPTALELWNYFNSVINWVSSTFRVKRKIMKGLPWGPLYNTYKDAPLDPNALEEKINILLADDEVEKKSGIYEYLLSGEEKHLHLRAFLPGDKLTAYTKQGGKCVYCGKECAIEEMEADHKTPWSKGGKTTPDNLQMLCRECNRRKGNR